MKFVIPFFLFFLSQEVFSQVKFEREYDLPLSEVPENASSFTNEYFGHLKLKWFIEESDKGKSIEAKSFKRRERLSIEFSPDGVLEDIEKNIKISSLNSQMRETISTQFKKGFKRFKIRKTQVQWSGEFESIKHFLKTKEELKGFKTAYEIEVEGKKDGSAAMYEYLFSHEGKLLSKKEIETRTTINLEF